MDWSSDGWAIVSAILAVLAAGFWFFDRFEKRLNNGDDKATRDYAAKALTAPGPWKAYLYSLRSALGALNRWMGQRAGPKIWTSERGDWARGFGWCLRLAFIYPPAILLLFWLFGGSATVGSTELLPPPENLAFWRRFLLVVIMAGAGTAFFFLVRNADEINVKTEAWLEHNLWRRLAPERRLIAKVALPLAIGLLVFAIAFFVLELPLALALAGALALLGGLAWAIPRVIDGWNAFVRWMGDGPSLNLATYLCNAASKPLSEGFWAVGMLFSTLLPTAFHLLFLIFAPLFWFIAWRFGAHATNRARAAHIELGTRPPKADLVRWTEEEIGRTRATPVDYGKPGFAEDSPIFQGKLNPQTVHKVALQLRVWRPLCYTTAFAVVLFTIWQLGILASTSWRPFPQILLYIAHNFDYAPVRQCFPDAPPTAPFETLAI